MNNPIVLILFYVVIIGGFWWLLMRPQKKEQKRVQLMLSELAVGDTVLTTSGFYGVVIDITDEDILEFFYPIFFFFHFCQCLFLKPGISSLFDRLSDVFQR